MNERSASRDKTVFELRMGELRREHEVSRQRARFASGRLAMAVQRDLRASRDFLEEVRLRLEEIDAETTGGNEAAFIFSLDVEAFLGNKRGEKRPSPVRWAAARSRRERAEARLGPEHPGVRRLLEREIIVRSNVPGERADAIAAFRPLLDDLGYPVSNFIASLRAGDFARMLRDSGQDSLRREQRDLVAQNLRFRIRRYGDEHPFTLVARAHSVLVDLIHLENVSDERPLSEEELLVARGLLVSTNELIDLRTRVMGDHHDGVVQALGYNARAHRLLTHRDDALRLASRALSQLVEDRNLEKDKVTPAILKVVVAEVLAGKVIEARRLASDARGAFHSSEKEHERAAYDRAFHLAIERARRQADESLDLAAEALDIMDHMRGATPGAWKPRARRVSETLYALGYGELASDQI